VVFVDSRGTLDPADWANELHPTASGSARLHLNNGNRRWQAPASSSDPRR
jgi:hypothetical protein